MYDLEKPEIWWNTKGVTRFSLDDELRRAGFKIYSRPTKGETLWRFGWTIFTESEVRVWLDQLKKQTKGS